MRLVCLGVLYSLHIFPGGYCYLSLHNWFLGDTQNYGGDTAWPWCLIRLDLAVHPDRAGSPSLNLTSIFSASRLNLVHIAMTTGSIDIWSCSLGINRSCYMNYLPEYSIFYWITLNECEFHLSLHSKLLCLHAALQLLTALVKKKITHSFESMFCALTLESLAHVSKWDQQNSRRWCSPRFASGKAACHQHCLYLSPRQHHYHPPCNQSDGFPGCMSVWHTKGVKSVGDRWNGVS